MCGIAGLLCWQQTADRTIVQAMIDRQIHRGPDAGGIEALGPLVLGHRRLAIIDVTPENDQPLCDRQGDLTIVFNGEIYNFRELRAELQAAGALFRTRGDTEVILEAYRAWGTGCLERFNGMFAFALWDAREQQLFLARDRVGEKPLFYAQLADAGLAFASEPRALRAHPAVGGTVDPIGLAHYLTLNYSIGEHSLLAGVRRLPPGHYLIARRGHPPREYRYWDLAACFRAKRRFASIQAAAEELTDLIDDAVRMRLVSDVPLGAFLSGGVDSSAVAAAMAKAVPAEQVQTFSVGFGVPTFDEVETARAVADHLGLDHQDRIVAADAPTLIQALIAAADEPLADTSVLPTWRLAAFAREQVSVVLSGDGADECFAGYETYLADRLHQTLRWLPAGAASGLFRLADRLLPVRFSKVSLDYKLRRFLAELHRPLPRAHAAWRDIFSAHDRLALVQPQWQALFAEPEADPFAQFAPHYAEVADCHWLDQVSYVDIKTWLADDILVKVDRTTMAHSLEARAPLLDHRLVEFAAALPVDWRLRGLRTKHILKHSQRQRLPRWVLNGRKRGFNAPVTHWLSGPLREFAGDTLALPRLHEWVRPEAIVRLWAEQDAGRRDHGLKLFGLLCLALWLDTL
ncbi:MAG: asparagine synthase (glutamine-hydrolyzing) [Chromatiaceae bacterium]|nr:MAG: asparagine synthase (glutamine-hydrolyzing) [Chromatiaceae bacterium]